MARHYSTKNFFRQVPNALLARYFADGGLFGDVDFAAMKETKPDELFAAWLDLTEEVRKPMDPEFQDIFELSCEKGFRAIIDEARWQTQTAPDTLTGLLKPCRRFSRGSFPKAPRPFRPWLSSPSGVLYCFWAKPVA